MSDNTDSDCIAADVADVIFLFSQLSPETKTKLLAILESDTPPETK